MTTTDMEKAQRVSAAGRAVARRIEVCERPVITSHVRLDGDALACELALADVLREMGKSPLIVNDGEIPKVYAGLPGIGEFVKLNSGPVVGDLVIVLDCPTLNRIGSVADQLPMTADVVRIDHHHAPEPVGSPEWVVTSASSVGEMLFDLFTDQAWPLSPEAATNLYVAIVTDTGRLSFPNTSPHTVRVCADLMERGADHVGVNDALYRSEDWEILQMRAEAVVGMKRVRDGRICVMRLTREMLRRHGVKALDIQEFADIPRSVAGVRVGVMLREMSAPGMVKISLRGCGDVDLRPVAREFGGGGHAEAAGCEVSGSLDSVEEKLMAAIDKHLDL